MSKPDKLLEKLARRPAPKDFRWDDLVTLMRAKGFDVSCSSGSHHTFQHTGGFTVSISRTHPGGILKLYQVKAALEALDKVKPDPKSTP